MKLQKDLQAHESILTRSFRLTKCNLVLNSPILAKLAGKCKVASELRVDPTYRGDRILWQNLLYRQLRGSRASGFK